MKVSLARRVSSEFVGSAFLLAAVIGSGIMAERLSNGNLALALLANTIATGAALVALIFAFAELSGAHFNPVVTFAAAFNGSLPWTETPHYLCAQVLGAICGTLAAHGMFGVPGISISHHVRSGPAQLFSEFVATFGLLVVILGCARLRVRGRAVAISERTPHARGSQRSVELYDPSVIPFAVGAYITSAYWFTSSTSFANPAVTIARCLSDTFAGIRPADVPLFVCAQFAGGLVACSLAHWLFASPSTVQPESTENKV